MRVALISVGTELLMGQTVNTNVVYLSQQLNLLGFDVLYHHTVGDNPGRLREVIDLSRKDCDLILTTGGLGPTQDDLTKEIACEAFHDELVLHEPSMAALKEAFCKRHRHMTDNNLKQAYMPTRAVVFDNDQGTAPGFALEDHGDYIICIPGPPREMKAMYQRRVKPFLESMSEGMVYFRDVMTYGIGESQLETALLPLIDAANIDLKGFTPAWYRRLGGSLDNVKRNIALAAENCHLEVTTLIVPDCNDSEEDMRRECAFLQSIDRTIPLHITRFFPRYQMADAQPTPVKTVLRLTEIAREYLDFVYPGNL